MSNSKIAEQKQLVDALQIDRDRLILKLRNIDDSINMEWRVYQTLIYNEQDGRSELIGSVKHWDTESRVGYITLTFNDKVIICTALTMEQELRMNAQITFGVVMQGTELTAVNVKGPGVFVSTTCVFPPDIDVLTVGSQYHGTLTTWKDENNYGFIKVADKDCEGVFVYRNQFSRKHTPREGDFVTFTYSRNTRDRNKYCANSVKVEDSV